MCESLGLTVVLVGQRLRMDVGEGERCGEVLGHFKLEFPAHVKEAEQMSSAMRKPECSSW
jgi:hypothetical protein